MISTSQTLKIFFIGKSSLGLLHFASSNVSLNSHLRKPLAETLANGFSLIVGLLLMQQ